MQRLIYALCALLLVPAAAVLGQETQQDEVYVPEVRLEGLTQYWQDFNRCSAAAFSIQLSYFDEWTGSYTETVNWLNPNRSDVSVRVEEMVLLAEEYGLKGVVRLGGTIELMERIVQAGFPLLVENVYYDGPNGWRDWMSHNRILMGYNSELREFYFFDPLLGNGPTGQGRAIPYDEFDERWRPFNRNYLLIYRPEEEELVQEILGEHWDPVLNAIWTVQQVEADIAGPYNDSFSLFNLGTARLVLGEYETAAENFDRAREIGLPWRFLWYQFGPFEAYLAVGRYQDTINLVRQVLADTTEVEELYYYIGQAYEGLGELDRALANYQAALWRNHNYVEAQQALQALREDEEDEEG